MSTNINKTLKKISVFVLVVAMLLVGTLIPGTAVASGEDGANQIDVWDGTMSSSLSGAGTETDPRIIATPEDFFRMIHLFGENGKHYKIVNDIYLNDVTVENWVDNPDNREWKNGIKGSTSENYSGYNGGNTNSRFTGTVDGQGHTVYGLWYKEDTTSTLSALFPAAATATIKNLGIDCARIVSNGGYSAAFVGSSRNANYSGNLRFENCYVGQDVTIITSVETYGEAGFLGVAENTGKKVTLTNCYSLFPAENLKLRNSSTGAITTNTNFRANALIGSAESLQIIINNCYSIARPFHTNNQSTRLSTGGRADYTNIYTTAADYTEREEYKGLYTTVSTTDIQGANALSKMPGFDPTVWYAVKADGAYPTFRLRGTLIGDVNEDGVFEKVSDTAALRVVIMDDTTPSNGDFNKDGTVNVCDLVALSK